jgi:tetraacyldisaccharide 4'-kinase
MFKLSKKYLSSIIIALLLMPWTWIYGLAIYLRNLLYTYGIKKSYLCRAKVISVGNIIAGGTGKTPCIEYLLRILGQNFYTVVLSRGYKRNTHGYRVASSIDTAATIGDEPYQIYKKFVKSESKISVVVGEDRVKAVKKLLVNYPQTEIILLDDGFQHRQLGRQLNILLTSFHRPFFKDYLLPAGRLRESRKAAARADIIIVTKCPIALPEKVCTYFIKQINKYCKNKSPNIFFSYIKYGKPISLWHAHTNDWQDHVILLTGIADSAPIVKYVHTTYHLLHHIAFEDHHRFTLQDIKKIVSTFDQITSKKKCILTTEKDSARLMESDLVPILRQLPIFFLPISMNFIAQEEVFKQRIFDCIKN